MSTNWPTSCGTKFPLHGVRRTPNTIFVNSRFAIRTVTSSFSDNLFRAVQVDRNIDYWIIKEPRGYAMKRTFLFAVALCVAVFSAQVVEAAENAAPEMPEMPKPQKEHAWLEKLAGEWDSETTIQPPGQP